MGRYWVNCRKWVNLRIQESCKWQDSKYLPDLNWKLIVLWVLRGFLCELILCYFFYQSWISVICLLPLTGVLVYAQWQSWKKQMLIKIEIGFKEWLYYIKGGLSAGKSVERAMLSCQEEFGMRMGQGHPVLLVLKQFYHNLSLHISAEECMRRLGQETQIETIEDFGVVFGIVQRQGGQVSAILERSIQQIYEKIDLRQEIHAMTAAKQLEQRIMCTMPFAILLFVGKASGGYFVSLYHNVSGICIMTICMMIYIVSVWWGQKLTEVVL